MAMEPITTQPIPPENIFHYLPGEQPVRPYEVKVGGLCGCCCQDTVTVTLTNMRLLKRYAVYKCCGGCKCCGQAARLDTMIFLKDIDYIRQYNPETECTCFGFLRLLAFIVCTAGLGLLCLCCRRRVQAIEAKGAFGAETFQLDVDQVHQACLDIPTAIGKYKSRTGIRTQF